MQGRVGEQRILTWVTWRRVCLNKKMGVIAGMYLTTTNPQTRSLFYNEQWNRG